MKNDSDYRMWTKHVLFVCLFLVCEQHILKMSKSYQELVNIPYFSLHILVAMCIFVCDCDEVSFYPALS